MRDVNRIPEILKTLEEIWMKNPDYRLGQLLTIAARPVTPHPTTFYKEDDEILEGLIAFANPDNEQHSTVAFWEKYPNVSMIKVEEITIEMVREYIAIIKEDKSNFVITPVKLMELNGAPVDDASWLSKQLPRIEKLKGILHQLEMKNELEVVQIGYRVKNEI